jgi:NAD(P)-dependent dehydrogenase (short-subunit alcohol dehydrogenase family)
MHNGTATPDLSGRHVLIPGGTGGIGEGAVRAYLAAGADVVVPTRSQERADEFRRLLGDAATSHLHLVVHDYTTFAGAEALAATMEDRLGSVDDVVAPIGGWWAGKQIWEIDESDWQEAFVRLATTHAAVLRAALPRMKADGAYSIIVGDSASIPVPGSGLVSMEQAALLMMQRVLAAELGGDKRVFALVLGPVRTRAAGDGDPDRVTAGQVGSIAVAASASAIDGREIRLRNQAELVQALALLHGTEPDPAGPIVAVSTMTPRPGQRNDLLALLAELAPQIRAEPGCLRYSVHGTLGDDNGPLLIIQEYESAGTFTAHSSAIAAQIPRLSPLLQTPPAPPALFGPVAGDAGPALGSGEIVYK